MLRLVRLPLSMIIKLFGLRRWSYMTSLLDRRSDEGVTGLIASEDDAISGPFVELTLLIRVVVATVGA